MMKRFKNVPVLFCFFVAVFFIGFANLILPDQDRSEMENRSLQQLPNLTVSGLLDSSSRGFAQKFETYLADQFAGRNAWITMKSVAEAALGKTENNGVAYGKDGYLFGIYRACDEENLEANLVWLETFAQLFPNTEKDLIIVPSAYEILTEQAPQGLGNLDELSRIDEINERLSASGYMPFDAASVLSSHKEDRQLYYRTDHHWTTAGAKTVYEAYLLSIGNAPAEIDEALLHKEQDFFGTYYSKAKKFNAIPDTLEWYDVPVDSVMLGNQAADGLYDFSKLETRDKYAMFLYGNNGVTTIENSAAPEGRILVIKDSYANSFVPFLTQSFSSVTVADLRFLPKGLGALIEEGSFDRILFLYNFENLASDKNFYRLRY